MNIQEGKPKRRLFAYLDITLRLSYYVKSFTPPFSKRTQGVIRLKNTKTILGCRSIYVRTVYYFGILNSGFLYGIITASACMPVHKTDRLL